MEQVKKFILDVGWVFFSSVATAFIGFALRIVLARWLGADNLGLYQMVITIQGIASLTAAFGIPSALTKYVAEYKDDRDKLAQTISSGFISSITLGIVVAILLYTVSDVLASVFHMPELAHFLRILAFAFPFLSLMNASIGLLNGLRRMKSYAFLLIMHNSLMILFTVVFVWLGFGIEGAVYGIVLSVIGGCIYGLFSLRSFLHLYPRRFAENAKKLFLFGSKVAGTDVLSLIITRTDTILIGYFLLAKDVGHYSIAVGLSGFILLVPEAIRKITYPATSEYWSHDDHGALQKMIDKSMKSSACILLPLGLGVAFFGKEIITILYGTDFIYATLPLYILLVGLVIRGGTVMSIGAAYSGIGRPDIALKLNFLSAGINVVLDIVLIPRFGIAGAALATSISLLVRVVVFLALMPKVLGMRIDIKWFSSAIGAAGIAVGLFIVGLRLTNPFPYIVGSAILCGYLILIYKVFITKEDKATFKSIIYSLVRRK